MQLTQLWATVCPTDCWTFAEADYFQIVQQAVTQLDCNQEHCSFLSKNEQTLKKFGALLSYKVPTVKVLDRTDLEQPVRADYIVATELTD